MIPTDDLEACAAAWTLGLVVRESLPAVAVAALERGVDNQPMRELAGLTQPEMAEAARLFEAAFDALGIRFRDKRAAVQRYAQGVCEVIVAGKVAPYDGANALSIAVRELSHEERADLDPFVYAADEWEDRVEDRPFFDKVILVAAQDWLDRNLGGRAALTTAPKRWRCRLNGWGIAALVIFVGDSWLSVHSYDLQHTHQVPLFSTVTNCEQAVVANLATVLCAYIAQRRGHWSWRFLILLAGWLALVSFLCEV